MLLKTFKTNAQTGVLVRIRALFGQIRVVLVGLVYIDHGHNLAGGLEVEDFAGLRTCFKTTPHAPMDQKLSMGVGY